jgi:serine/threonine-protein kinase
MTPLYCNQGHENPPGGRFCLYCGQKLEQPASKGIYPGLVLGERYRVVRELGHGGFGRTYLAEDLNRFNESCVLKEFAPQAQGTYALQKAEELFSREADVLYKLQHPQIPKFRELFRAKHEDKGFLFLVQDFVVGQTYRALLDARRSQGLRFNEAEVTQLLLQILPVLEYIHAMGVIHRDISPDNLILCSTDGLPVLIDFGGVKQLAATVAYQFMASQGAGDMPAIATRLGKVGYAPHEQMYGGIVFPHSDLYALAATALVLLAGKEPQHLIDPHSLEWNWQQEVSLSPRLGSVLDRMLHPIPDRRFASAGDVLQALTMMPAPAAHAPTLPPSPKTEATLAVAPPPIAAPANSPSPPTAEMPSPSPTNNPSSGWLGKVFLVFVLIVGAGGFGWLAGNLWIKSQIKSNEVNPQPTQSDRVAPPQTTPTPEPSEPFPDSERRRKEALQQRRTALDIRYSFYADLVNEEYWTQFPDQRGRTLGTRSEEAQAREQWDAIASDLLGQLDRANLSAASRRQLGSFSDADLARAKAEVNQFRLSSRSLYDLVDARFLLAFPQHKGKDFLKKPIGQVWRAMVTDTLNEVKSGAAFEQIAFDPGAVNKQLSGTLKPGEGKVVIASLSTGQVLKVNLSTSGQSLFSLYSPSGKTTLLEDSGDRTWSGQLPESGFYEFVVVSNASGSINYQLDITVENSATPEPSPVGSVGR